MVRPPQKSSVPYCSKAIRVKGEMANGRKISSQDPQTIDIMAACAPACSVIVKKISAVRDVTRTNLLCL